MPDEQPYFTVKVTRCGECPHLDNDDYCQLVTAAWPYPSKAFDAAKQNKDGLTPSCPMWAQWVREKKDG